MWNYYQENQKRTNNDGFHSLFNKIVQDNDLGRGREDFAQLRGDFVNLQVNSQLRQEITELRQRNRIISNI